MHSEEILPFGIFSCPDVLAKCTEIFRAIGYVNNEIHCSIAVAFGSKNFKIRNNHVI